MLRAKIANQIRGPRIGAECDIMWAAKNTRGEKMPVTIFDRFKRPPVADFLGWKIVELNLDEKSIKLAFEAKPEFLNR
jgi:hypothetical protein